MGIFISDDDMKGLQRGASVISQVSISDCDKLMGDSMVIFEVNRIIKYEEVISEQPRHEVRNGTTAIFVS